MGERRVPGVVGTAVIVAWALFAMAVAPLTVEAQTAEAEVVGVVEKLFQGMLARDTAMMRSTMDPQARLIGLTPTGEVRVSTPDQFIGAIGGMEGEGANERIFDPEVRIDGNLATVWTFYTLHIGDRFSHCGYDAFTLYRTTAGWKIVSIADTRRTEGCEAGNV